MKSPIGLILAITSGVSACGGPSSSASASDASVEAPSMSMDAAGDATPEGCPSTGFPGCPASEPVDGADCPGDCPGQFGSVSLVCQYAGTVCTCRNLVPSGAAWTCTSSDAASDAGPLDCTYDDGGATLDASSRFNGSCAGGCPAGTVCAVEIGGVAGGGGEYCAPIMDRCKNDVTCACLGSCVCGTAFGRPQTCTDTHQSGMTTLACDDGVR